MTKYEFAKLFSDVDDKYIEGARPEPQKAVMIKTRKAPVRMIAAASCAAVLIGGVITVAALHLGKINTPGNSNTASITNDGELIYSDEATGNWFSRKEIFFEGEAYTVANDSIGATNYREDPEMVDYEVGLRISSENTIDAVAAIVNTSEQPVGILCFADGDPLRLKFGGKYEDIGAEVIDTNVESPRTETLLPGEALFYKASFDSFSGKCKGLLKFVYEDERRAWLIGSAFRGEITDGGFMECAEADNWYNDEQIFYEGELYTVLDDPPLEYSGNNEIGFRIGVRKSENDTIDIVTVFRNECENPIGLRCLGYDHVANVELGSANSTYQGALLASDKPFAVTLQPGETCYQKSSFDMYIGEMAGHIEVAYEDKIGRKGESVRLSVNFGFTMTKDGFKEQNENEATAARDHSDKVLTPEEWAQKPLVLPSKSVPDDFDFIHTTNGYIGSTNKLIPADEGSEVCAVDDGEVIFADYNNVWNAGFGSVVVIKHGEGIYTIYSGLLPVEKGGKAFVSAGDKVTSGAVIGQAGYSGIIPEYGVEYGFYTELPWYIAEKVFGVQIGDRTPSSARSDSTELDGSDDDIPRIILGNIDLTKDLDGDGIPDELKEINPDFTLENWEELKRSEMIS